MYVYMQIYIHVCMYKYDFCDFTYTLRFYILSIFSHKAGEQMTMTKTEAKTGREVGKDSDMEMKLETFLTEENNKEAPDFWLRSELMEIFLHTFTKIYKSK